MRSLVVAVAVFTLGLSCTQTDTHLTTSEKEQIIASATEVVKEVFDHSNNMDFEAGLIHYSSSPHSYYITDGVMHTLSDLRQAYKKVGPSVEALHNTIESWNVDVLSSSEVTVTLPVKLKLKLKGIPEYTGKLIWTATLQKQENKWVIVQSHESWLNCAEVALALTPPDGN